jgi:hydrogenase nickel incorporation protein HypA/HybF
MHEFSLMADLMRKIESIAAREGAKRVVGLKVRLGALSHVSPEHFGEHFARAARGTLAEGVRLEVEAAKDQGAPRAQDILLESITLEEA